MLNGRNPINLALLKPGVRGGAGGSLNSFQPDSLSDGGFNINGSRGDENLITIDGAIATRTRSAGAIIGTVNVDTVSEIQILTASYLPEYGRSSGGQIRFVTKGGGRDFHADVYEFFRDESLDANSWARNNSPLPELNSQPAPFNFNQYGYDIGGPLFVPGKFNTNRDKLFFFWAQEWIHYDREETNTAHGAHRGHAARRLQRAAEPDQPVLRPPGAGPRPAHRPALPRQRDPGQPPEPERAGPAQHVSRADRRASSAAPTTGSAPAPTRGDTRKDTLRLDFVPNAQNNDLVPRVALQLEGRGRLPRRLPARAHRLGPAQPDGRR